MNVSAKLSSPHYLTVSSLSGSVLDHSSYKIDPFWFWEEFTPRSVSIAQYKDNSINSDTVFSSLIAQFSFVSGMCHLARHRKLIFMLR